MLRALAFAVLAVATTGAKGDGCSAFDESPAPDMTGVWDMDYDDQLAVRVTLGGAVYESTIGAAGGQVTIEHDGHPLTFDLDCDRPEVICPSEAWPSTVTVRQRERDFEHQVLVDLPTQTCDGELVASEASACGVGTRNPDCDLVCGGETIVGTSERVGVIGADGSTFRIYLGAGIASNGVNCLLLAGAVADGDLVTSGVASRGTWRADEIVDGAVKVAYAGGCLWAGDPDGDGDPDALVLNATVAFESGFVGSRR